MKFYLDTSIFGGYFENEFSRWTKIFIQDFLSGRYAAVLSDLTMAELRAAPSKVRELAEDLLLINSEFVKLNEQAEQLAEKYLQEKIVARKFRQDAFILPWQL